MHASQKWIRGALLGGVALSVMATGAQAADDLSALKSQLEALQARVNQIEARPSTATQAALPEGASFISIRRGSNLPGFNDVDIAEAGTAIPTDRGYTIAITPAADLPAPIMEVTVSGYVKADFIVDFHNDLGPFASTGAVAIGAGDVEHVQFHARESRIRVKSRSDTAIGQLRTLIEVDFFGANGNELISNSHGMRLRHAWGEWDITPQTTLGFGQFWTIWFPIGFAPAKLDFTSPAGAHFQRAAQFRVTHRSGPWTLWFSANNPETDLRTAGGVLLADSIGSPVVADKAPDLLAAIQYAAGGHAFKLSGVGRFLSIDSDAGAGGSDTEFGGGIQANLRIALTSAFKIYATGIWGDGIGRYLLHNVGGAGTLNAAGTDINTNEAWGAQIGFSAKLSPAWTLTGQGGYYENTDAVTVPGVLEEAYSGHLTLLWQPVSKFRLGIEGIYRFDRDRAPTGGDDDEDNFRLHAAATFFF